MNRFSSLFAVVSSSLLAVSPLHAKSPVGKASDLKMEYEKGCSSGNAEACVALARVYQHGLGVHEDSEQAVAQLTRAVELTRAACDGSDASACSRLAYWYGGARRDYGPLKSFRDVIPGGAPLPEALYDLAANIHAKACDAGDANACTRWGDVYRSKLGGWCSEATVHWEKGCLMGSAWGCLLAGIAKEHGWGARVDEKVGAEFLRRSDELFGRDCDAGVAAACVELGNSYDSGYRSLRKDEPVALSLWEKACSGGAAEGCEEAAHRLDRDGTDAARATALYEQGCVKGSESCCRSAAWRYDEGAQKDSNRARAFYERACAEGGDDSCRTIDRLREKTAKSSAAAAAASAAAKKRADDIAACEAACAKKKKAADVCKRVCAQ